MPWPLSQDYNEAIQSPETCFADEELRDGQAAFGRGWLSPSVGQVPAIASDA
jgi:hypothetical protein